MIKNSKLLEDWLFFYKAESNVWHAILKEDYMECLRDPDYQADVITSTSMDYLMTFITTQDKDLN
jgi:hypothetical protein